MNLLTFLFFVILICIIPFFSVYVQTIKNLIVFIILIILICVNLMLFYNLEFFPIFFMLVYIGAIVVTTLFMVLTFDLRAEYVKKIFSTTALANAFLYFFLTSVFFAVLALAEKYLWIKGTLTELNRALAFHECSTRGFIFQSFCDKHFAKAGFDKGLYHAVGERVNDMAVISANLYTSYSVLFVILGVVLTVALLAALTLLKGGK